MNVRFTHTTFLPRCYDHLGINPQHMFVDMSGRPVALTHGEPVQEL